MPKEYVRKKPRALEFNIEIYVHFVILLSRGIFELEIYKMLKVQNHFFNKEFIKSKKKTLDTIENFLKRS